MSRCLMSGRRRRRRRQRLAQAFVHPQQRFPGATNGLTACSTQAPACKLSKTCEGWGLVLGLRSILALSVPLVSQDACKITLTAPSRRGRSIGRPQTPLRWQGAGAVRPSQPIHGWHRDLESLSCNLW